ncbi:hypothetical protein ACFW1M_03380 [Streptomyces inhibens]|uniref:hypothetical protein n=1 Tax=Streptomyces inhibens TaxID=2293571 RepID=UPI00369D6C23
MGLEGAVRLGYRKEPAAVADPAERPRAFEARVAEPYEQGKAVNAAAALEIDAVIGPAGTRSWVTAAPGGHAPRPFTEVAAKRRPFIDSW